MADAYVPPLPSPFILCLLEQLLNMNKITPLEYGTEEEHRATLQRAKENGVSYVWSGDVRRNRYLAENICFGEEAGILTTEYVEQSQESGWNIKWL